MVAPQTSSRLAGAEDIALVGVGHTALVGDAAATDRALALIDAESALAAPGSATSESPA
jgi:hypothetical protein